MGMSDQVGNELDEFVTDTLRNNLLGLPMDLADHQHGPGPLRGRAAAERAAPAAVHAKTNDGQLTPYTSWVDFGENLKHPESLVNFVAAYGTAPRPSAPPTTVGGQAGTRPGLIVDPEPGDVAAGRRGRIHEQHRRMGQRHHHTGLDNVDLWVGGLAEVTNPFGGLLGSTFNYVFENQLTNLQNGDRLYYLARTPGMNLRTQLEGNSFAELIMRNTNAHTR